MSRATAAVTGSVKKNQAWAPLPDLERSTSHVFLPASLVEVHGQKTTGVVRQERIDAYSLFSLEVLPDHLIADLNIRLVFAVTALDPRKFSLTTECVITVINAGRHITLAVPLLAYPELGEDIFPPPEERTKQGDLVRLRERGRLRGGSYFRFKSCEASTQLLEAFGCTPTLFIQFGEPGFFTSDRFDNQISIILHIRSPSSGRPGLNNQP